ncbi:nuclear nucleic acid-binding protein C1D-like [Ceratina calcarata]|uniref:Nuclear nucleic acid-binding protein C1D n=1 Tax=Ceratina calcarata TaxID=156304 RepID=A0AAJ7JG01_9HYME|nr:nuclear nucleic acid-binding protein C1D-like [Ceratina calcarata]
MGSEFEELSNDADIISKIQQFREATIRIDDTIKLALNPATYETLSNTDKVEYNLLLSYCLNSMFWMYLRAEGTDPAKHRIRSENERLKKSMLRAKQINDRKTLMPRINKDAAQRFVRNGLWEIKKKDK